MLKWFPYAVSAQILIAPFRKDDCIARLRNNIEEGPNLIIGEVDGHGRLSVVLRRSQRDAGPAFMRLVADIEDELGQTKIRFRVIHNPGLIWGGLFWFWLLFMMCFGKSITCHNCDHSLSVGSFFLFCVTIAMIIYIGYQLGAPTERDYLLSWLKDICVPGWNARRPYAEPETDEMIPKDWRDF